MADFKRDFFQGGGDERESAEKLRVAVALNDLGSNGRNAKPEAFADALFHFRTEVRSVADGTGNLANSHLRGGVAESRDVALIFCEPVGDFQTKGDGLGVNTVSAPDLRGVADLVRSHIENFSEHHQSAFDQF